MLEDVRSLVIRVDVRYSVVVMIAVTKDVLPLRVVISVCVLIKVDNTVSVDNCKLMEVVVLSFVRYLVEYSIVNDVVLTFWISRGCVS